MADPGFSGSNLNRPQMQRLIADVQAGKVSAVVVYKLDRLSRSQKDTLYLIEDIFIPHNAAFVSLNENIDTGTPYGRAVIGILSRKSNTGVLCPSTPKRLVSLGKMW